MDERGIYFDKINKFYSKCMLVIECNYVKLVVDIFKITYGNCISYLKIFVKVNLVSDILSFFSGS